MFTKVDIAPPCEGWSVIIFPVRSTVLVVSQFSMGKPSLSALCSRAPSAITGVFDTQGSLNGAGFIACQELLELFVFREDVLESLIHNLVGRGMNERCVLVDGAGKGLFDCNGGGHMSDLLN